MLRLAFYKGPTNTYGKLVRLATLSTYSHVELLIDDVAFSSVPGVGTRYLLYPGFKDEDWDFIDAPADVVERSYVWNWCMTEVGCPHDPYGVFRTGTGLLSRADPDAWFSSEYCARALKMVGRLRGIAPERVSPGRLAKLLRAPGFR